MKKILILAALAASSSPVMAAEANHAEGYATLSAGYGSLNLGAATSSTDYTDGSHYSSSYDLPKDNGLAIAGRFTAAAPVSGKLVFQADGVFDRNGFGIEACSDCNLPNLHRNEMSIAGHLFWRDPAKGLVGIVAQRSSVSSNYGIFGNSATNYLGAEGQIRAGRVSLNAQLAYVMPEYLGNTGSGIAAIGQLRYFPKDNFLLALKGGLVRGSVSRVFKQNDSDYTSTSGFKDHMTTVSANSEYRLKNSRFSLLANAEYFKDGGTYYQRSNIDYNNEVTLPMKQFRVMVGFKFNFGSSSLIDRDRSGASLDPVPALNGVNILGGVA